jgi:pseudouridine kinase
MKILAKDPLISQEELAKILGITRSSVAVHITNLMKKGKILGKGYLINPDQFVLVIGGAAVDIQGFPDQAFRLYDSNPGVLKTSLGGVGRNIADNLSRLKVATKFISAIGDDLYGKKILQEASLTNLDMSDSLICSGMNTSTYLSMLNEQGDMVAAISDMKLIDRLTVDHLKKKDALIKSSSYLVLDTNLSFEVIDYLTSIYQNIPIILDPVSVAKAHKVKDIIGRFHTIKPNKYEAEFLTGIKIQNESDLHRVEEYLLNKGVKQMFISLGSEGLFYSNGEQRGRLTPYEVKVINTTGAGDAFVAAVAYGCSNQMGIEQIAIFAQAAATLVLSYEDTINPAFTEENIMKILEEHHGKEISRN